MSYVDAIYDRMNDTIKVVERDKNGVRKYRDHKANHVFYYEDPRGSYKSMWGVPCKKYQSHNSKAFAVELSQMSYKKIHESDINPIFRCLEENYLNEDSPVLNIGFFDIEVDVDFGYLDTHEVLIRNETGEKLVPLMDVKDNNLVTVYDEEKHQWVNIRKSCYVRPPRGFARPWDPFAKVTAISLYLTNLSKIITLVLKPDLPTHNPHHLSWDDADKICSEFSDTILCNDEAELLSTFVDLLDDCDVISGWNSKGFDIPYIVNRIDRILDPSVSKRLCLWDQKPKKKKFIKFKKEHETYELSGRIHLDYLELYQKNTYSELHSYRLDFIGEIEVGENKIPYEGSLDDLYKKDFKKFVEYNRQDVMLLVKIDQKRRFIDLANQLCHTNTVLLPTTMGSVALIEQAIVNETHRRGMVVMDRKHKRFDDDDDDTDQGPAVGAYVAVPKIGLQDYIGCCDINSLYPSALRALNMGPETLIGQIRCDRTDEFIRNRIISGMAGPEAWHEVFAVLEFDLIKNKSDEIMTVDFESGETYNLSGKDLHELIYGKDSTYVLSANGTIFRKDVEAIIPGLLSRWYSERKTMQGKGKEFLKKAKEVKDSNPQEYEDLYEQHVFWDQRQLARKILLNSLYGAILNQGCRFYDHRIGQSVTLSGRSITRHMIGYVNYLITGTTDYKGDAIIYSDTDSVYFSLAHAIKMNPGKFDDLAPILTDKSAVVEYYDWIGDTVNDSFPEFMNSYFNTGLDRGQIIKAGRELVGIKGLFITKKRYAILVYDMEGNRLDVDGKPGKIKAMGLDIKRSDTPKFMQDFLEDILTDLLNGSTEDKIIDKLKEFRLDFRNMDAWEQGTPKKVNGITGYQNRVDSSTSNIFETLKATSDKSSTITIPGHVRASMNWNTLKRMNKDYFSSDIQDGAKVIVCRLKKNNYGFDSISYPVDQQNLPEWFRELPFDSEDMENSIIDKKVSNLLGVLEWDLEKSKDDSTFDDLFQF